MGFLDDILGRMTSGSSPSGNLSALSPVLMDMLRNHPGGLAGLVQRFESQGLGHLISSWIGPGANLPISVDQLQSVLGSDALKSMGARAGIPADQVAPALTQLLPHMVDHLTPSGEIPGSR